MATEELYTFSKDLGEAIWQEVFDGRWPSGKARAFGAWMRRFESYPPSFFIS